MLLVSAHLGLFTFAATESIYNNLESTKSYNADVCSAGKGRILVCMCVYIIVCVRVRACVRVCVCVWSERGFNYVTVPLESASVHCSNVTPRSYVAVFSIATPVHTPSVKLYGTEQQKS